jgi:predicted Zn finger-like uncharacterized protein
VIARNAVSMILTCPACDTRYRVHDQEFAGSTGRTVRCANCGHVWYESAAIRQKSAAETADQGAPVDHDEAAGRAARRAAAVEIPRLDIPPRTPPAPSRARSRASGVAGIVALLAAIIIGGVFIDRHFAADQPAPAAAPDATAAVPAPETGIGLVIRKITPARTPDGLVVDGEIVNPGSVPRDVPRLRVALQDSAEKELLFKTVDPPKPRLEPGEVVHFETPFPNPPDAATGVVVTFASS